MFLSGICSFSRLLSGSTRRPSAKVMGRTAATETKSSTVNGLQEIRSAANSHGRGLDST